MLMLVMTLLRGTRLRSKEQATAVLRSSGDMVYPASLGEPPLLATEDVAIDARLQAVLVVREGVEAEVKQALTVSFACGVRDEVSQQALPVLRMGLAEQASEGPKGSQLAQLSALQLRRRGRIRQSRRLSLLSAVSAEGGCSAGFQRGSFASFGSSLLSVSYGPGSHSLGTVSHRCCTVATAMDQC